MASIKERKGKYCVIYSFKNSDGKKKQKWETYKTREEAEKRRKKIEREEAAGGFTVPACSCLDDLLREYVALYGKDKWALSTYERNSRMIANYISPMIGGTKISDISTRFLELYYQRLLSTPAVRNNAPRKEGSGMVGMSTIRDIHKLLRSCFEQAVKWEIMEKNPSLRATVPRYKSKKREIWTADVFMRATELCGDGELKLAMNLAFSGSLRIGELVGLTWDCVDISPEAVEKNCASIFINKEFQRVSKEAVSQLGGKDIILVFPSESPRCTTVRVLKTPKTESSIRRVYLPRSVAHMLLGWKEEQEKAKEFAGEEYHDYNLVMATWSGMPIGISVIEKHFAKLIRENGLPEVVFHSLRHSSITYKLKLNGGDIKSVQGDSGHAQSKMVSDVYSHIIDEDRRRNAEAFEEAFYGKKNLSPSLSTTVVSPAGDVPGEALLPGSGVLSSAALLSGVAQMTEGIDPELLAKVLSNPEMLALISALAKSIHE